MSEYLVAFWNVENLFGPENHADRIDWVADAVGKDLQGWTSRLYQKKLDQLASIVKQMNDGRGPDILGVCEVEDDHVLGDFATTLNQYLQERNYGVIHATSDLSSRGIDTAFLFDTKLFTVDRDLVFNHFVMRRTGTRDILQATFQSNSKKELVVMANHWPSRYGGQGPQPSAGFRATAGETLSYWHKRIREEAPARDRTPVLVLGDMNDDPWDDSLIFNARATRERGDVERATSERFYNFTWEYLSTPATDHKGKQRVLEGSLYYNNNGNLFDQILANRPLLDTKNDSHFKVINGSAGIIAFPEMVSHHKGEGPIRFGLPKGNATDNINEEGFSDHFPIGIRVHET